MNSLLLNENPADLDLDDLRDLMGAVAQTTERLEATHTALQNQVARLQKELAEANAQLRRSRSLAALGEMAAGIAHEVRNPLGSIQLYVQVLAEELSDRPEQAKLCSKIDRAVVGLDAIVRDVLSFARNTRIDPHRVRVSALFDRAVEGCAALLSGGGVRISRSIGSDHEIEADCSLMTQALGNVVRNAIEAMAGANQSSKELRLNAERRRMRCPDGNQAVRTVLAVEDTGPGIAPEVVDRMFNPFFTTRKTGTGLGLAIVHRIVDAHGGHINVKPARPHGTRVELCLPKKARIEPAGESLSHTETQASQPQTVLMEPVA